MKFKKGNRVEVLRRGEEQCVSWFPARITSVEGNMCSVKYELFLASDGKSVVETVAEEDVRPCPPPLKQKKPWIAGDEAEALDICSWRVGKVLRVLKVDRVVIKLSGCIQLKEYSVSDLRVPQAWHDDQWNMIDKVRKDRFKAHFAILLLFFIIFLLAYYISSLGPFGVCDFVINLDNF